MPLGDGDAAAGRERPMDGGAAAGGLLSDREGGAPAAGATEAKLGIEGGAGRGAAADGRMRKRALIGVHLVHRCTVCGGVVER